MQGRVIKLLTWFAYFQHIFWMAVKTGLYYIENGDLEVIWLESVLCKNFGGLLFFRIVLAVTFATFYCILV